MVLLFVVSYLSTLKKKAVVFLGGRVRTSCDLNSFNMCCLRRELSGMLAMSLTGKEKG